MTKSSRPWCLMFKRPTIFKYDLTYTATLTFDFKATNWIRCTFTAIPGEVVSLSILFASSQTCGKHLFTMLKRAGKPT